MLSKKNLSKTIEFLELAANKLRRDLLDVSATIVAKQYRNRATAEIEPLQKKHDGIEKSLSECLDIINLVTQQLEQ